MNLLDVSKTIGNTVVRFGRPWQTFPLKNVYNIILPTIQGMEWLEITRPKSFGVPLLRGRAETEDVHAPLIFVRMRISDGTGEQNFISLFLGDNTPKEGVDWRHVSIRHSQPEIFLRETSRYPFILETFLYESDLRKISNILNSD